jgi:hypothetical protein
LRSTNTSFGKTIPAELPTVVTLSLIMDGHRSYDYNAY